MCFGVPWICASIRLHNVALSLPITLPTVVFHWAEFSRGAGVSFVKITISGVCASKDKRNYRSGRKFWPVENGPYGATA